MKNYSDIYSSQFRPYPESTCWRFQFNCCSSYSSISYLVNHLNMFL